MIEGSLKFHNENMKILQRKVEDKISEDVSLTRISRSEGFSRL